jgi:hypothetical protein
LRAKPTKCSAHRDTTSPREAHRQNGRAGTRSKNPRQSRDQKMEGMKEYKPEADVG